MIHGFAHILGFSHKDYQFYYDPTTGEPQTARPFKETRAAAQKLICKTVILQFIPTPIGG